MMLVNQSVGVPVGASVLGAALVTAAMTFGSFGMDNPPAPDQHTSREVMPREVMLILRGIANSDNPRGQLDDSSALQYARRRGFRGELLDVAGNTGADSPQVNMALERIRRDETVTAIYGFSGGGYNARLIWRELTAAERERIRTIIVVGSPQVAKADFPGKANVRIKSDPPEGHMAGPTVLLEAFDPEQEFGE